MPTAEYGLEQVVFTILQNMLPEYALQGKGYFCTVTFCFHEGIQNRLTNSTLCLFPMGILLVESILRTTKYIFIIHQALWHPFTSPVIRTFGGNVLLAKLNGKLRGRSKNSEHGSWNKAYLHNLLFLVPGHTRMNNSAGHFWYYHGLLICLPINKGIEHYIRE